MKTKLIKITELLKAEKAYNNIPYVLGMLDAMIMDLDENKSSSTPALIPVSMPTSKSFFWK